MIRQACADDLDKIALLHAKCFPNSFSTVLGYAGKYKLLKNYYNVYLKRLPELFLVSENASGDLTGLCMGYFCENNDYLNIYLKENFLRIALRMFKLLLCGNRLAWRKIKNTFCAKEQSIMLTDEFNDIPKEKCGNLLSICVLPECRGDGTAQGLVDRYTEILKQNERLLCFLTVEKSNARGIHFYEKNGFVPYKEVGGISLAFAKKI